MLYKLFQSPLILLEFIQQGGKTPISSAATYMEGGGGEERERVLIEERKK